MRLMIFTLRAAPFQAPDIDVSFAEDYAQQSPRVSFHAVCSGRYHFIKKLFHFTLLISSSQREFRGTYSCLLTIFACLVYLLPLYRPLGGARVCNICRILHWRISRHAHSLMTLINTYAGDYEIFRNFEYRILILPKTAQIPPA